MGVRWKYCGKGDEGDQVRAEGYFGLEEVV